MQNPSPPAPLPEYGRDRGEGEQDQKMCVGTVADGRGFANLGPQTIEWDGSLGFDRVGQGLVRRWAYPANELRRCPQNHRLPIADKW